MKKAFTLAEVLITLGIIGVVAAMTIPNLISNYQKRAWTAQLQKSYATLNQGFRRMLADENVSALSETETFNSIGGEDNEGSNGGKYKACLYTDAIDSENCKDFYHNLGKYFKIADIRTFTESDNYIVTRLNGRVPFNPYIGNAITLMDGSMIWYPLFYSEDKDGNTNNRLSGKVGAFNLDVNGKQKPNIVGRDIFVFLVGNNGVVYPHSSLVHADYMGASMNNKSEYYWKTSSSHSYSCLNNIQSVTGQACSARVLEEGKMNY